MISARTQWPLGPVGISWIPQPNSYTEPVTAVHCFCFSGDALILVNVAGRGPSIPGGHVQPGESLLQCLHRELAEEAERCAEHHHEWNDVLQAAFEDAVSWRAGQE